jgi:hypothetical protein
MYQLGERFDGGVFASKAMTEGGFGKIDLFCSFYTEVNSRIQK